MNSKSEPPLVSIVIPVFNCGSVLAETLESARAQTFRDFEVIIVDDGSTDDSAAIARRFCEMDPRFSLVQQANAGVSAARNVAIQRARGEWLAFLDGDDIWFPEKLAAQMKLSREDPRANLLFTNYLRWDGSRDIRMAYVPEEPLPEGDVLQRLIFAFLYIPSAVVVRRQTLLEAGLFDPELKLSEDWDMWLRIAERGIWARGTREPFMRYRRWPGSHVAKNRKLSLETGARMLEKHIREARLPDLLPLYKRSFASISAYIEMVDVYLAMETNPNAVPDFVWREWRRERRLKWLRWYLFLQWPDWLGGRLIRRDIFKKALVHLAPKI
jgi:glycosyltransferase involved in cell wall biosynthesis